MIDSKPSVYALRLAAKLLLAGVLLLMTAGGSLAQGTVWAWGDNSYGELGHAPGTDGDIVPEYGVYRLVPFPVLGANGLGTLSGVTEIAAGSEFGLALDSNGTVWAWGSGALGNNLTSQSYTPLPVLDSSGTAALSGITTIAAGNDQSLALASNGTIWAWGGNSYGDLGNGLTSQSNTPVQVVTSTGTGTLSGITAIAAGNDGCLALASDGTVWAWGYNLQGQLGNNSANSTANPLPMQVVGSNGTGTLTGITAIAAGRSQFNPPGGDGALAGGFSLALASNGTVWAWGDNTLGELGHAPGTAGDVYNSGYGFYYNPEPVHVVGSNGTGTLTGIVAVAAGSNFCLALASNGTVWAWGSNILGSLGHTSGADGDVYNSADESYYNPKPVQVVGPNGTGTLSGITAIGAGNGYGLALTSNGTVLTWGANSEGVLGNTSIGGPMPSPVIGPSGAGILVGVTAIASGGGFSLALNGGQGYQLLWQGVSNGEVYQWLMNQNKLVSSSEILGGISSAWKIVGSGSFSGNPTPDILWQNESTGEVGIWQMNGGTFLDYVQIEKPGVIGAGWQIVGVSAVPNILWQNTKTGEVGYWQMSGTTIVTYHQIEPPGVIASGWQIVGAGNFSGAGGESNILWQNAKTGEIGYWTLTSDGQFSSYTQIEAPGVVSTEWHVGATPDISGNGSSNIVWQNVSTGEIGYWTLNGGKFSSYTQIEAPGVVSPSTWLLRGWF